MPINIPPNPEVSDLVRLLKTNFDSREFEVDHAGANVTSATGRYQRLGDLVFVTYRFSGTSMSFSDSSQYITLPIKALTKANKSTAHVFPTSTFLFATTNGDVLDNGHQLVNTDRIVPDATVSGVNELVVTGWYWANPTT